MDFEQEYGIGQWGGLGGAPGSGSGFFDNPYAIAGAVTGLGQVVGGFGQLSGSRAGAAAMRQNAAEALALAQRNAGLQSQIAGVNAAAVRNISKFNAKVQLQTAQRNGQLMMLEGVEAMRREARESRYLLSSIRVQQSPSGWNLNQGTPRAVLEGARGEAEHRLAYSAFAKEMSLFTMLSNASDQAKATLYAGEQQAGAIQASAALANEIMLGEAQAQYNAMMREAAAYRNIGKANAYGQIFGGIGAAAGYAFGGPVGGIVGGALGSTLGSIF